MKSTHELFINSDIKQKELKFERYLSTILIKLSKNKELISNISFNSLFQFINELLNYLLLNNPSEFGENNQRDFIYKTFNRTMIRLIENCYKTYVILIFLEILKNYQKGENKETASLALKCLLKSTQNITQIINGINISKILKEMNIILYNFKKIYPDLRIDSEIDKLIVRSIKDFIYKVAKLKEDIIMEIYNNSIKISGIEDIIIIHWIKTVLENKNKAKSDKSLNFSINNEIINNSINNSTNNIINNIYTNKDKNNEQKKDDNINEEKNKKSKNKDNNVNIKNNTVNDKGDKGNNNNTMDQLKKKWNDVKFK